MNHKDKEMLYGVLTARSRLQFLERDIHIHLQVVGVPQQRSAHFTQTLFLFYFPFHTKMRAKSNVSAFPGQRGVLSAYSVYEDLLRERHAASLRSVT